MARAGEVERFSTIVHPRTGRLFDVTEVENHDGIVTIRGLNGPVVHLDEDDPVHVLREPEPKLSWVRALLTLAVPLAVVGLLILVAFLGSR